MADVANALGHSAQLGEGRRAASPSSTVPSAGRYLNRQTVGFFSAWLALIAIIWLVPRPATLSPAGLAVLAVVAWASIMWVTEAIPTSISGLMIPLLLVLTGGATPFTKAADGFSTPVVFICMAAFIFAAIMQTVGLDRRIALSLLRWFRVKSVNGVIWAMFVVNLILSFIIPAANSRAATLLPVVNGMTKFLGDDAEGRNGRKAIVIQTLVYGSMISGMCILTAHLPNYILVNLFAKDLGVTISYYNWFLLQWPYLGMFVITQWWVQFYFRTHSTGIQGGAAAVEKLHSELPRTSAVEWRVMAVFAAVALGWMLEPLHGIASHNVALLGLGAAFAPGIAGYDWKKVQDQTIWGTLLLLAGALSLSSAMSSSGLAKWMAAGLHPAEGMDWWLAVPIVMVATHIIRLGLLSNVAAVAMLAPVLIALAPKLGLHPVAFTMLVADTDTFAYLLPTQITAAVIAYSSGTFSMSDYFKVGWVSVVIAIIYGLVVMTSWYAYMGIPVWDPSAPWPFK